MDFIGSKFGIADGNSLLVIHPSEKFLRQHFVGGGAGAVAVVVDDRLAEAWGFRKLRAARDQRLKNTVAQQSAHFTHDLLGELEEPTD